MYEQDTGFVTAMFHDTVRVITLHAQLILMGTVMAEGECCSTSAENNEGKYDVYVMVGPGLWRLLCCQIL